jgi:formylmethanofuran dehydrogenase subunit A
VEIRKEAILLEANYVMKHHHEYAKECRYEDLERLAAETRGIMAKVGRLSWEKYAAGNRVGNEIEIAYYEMKQRQMNPKFKELSHLISAARNDMKEGIEGAQAEKLTEEQKPIYAPMNALEQRRWRERLKYVDQVDRLPVKE